MNKCVCVRVRRTEENRNRLPLIIALPIKWNAIFALAPTHACFTALNSYSVQLCIDRFRCVIISVACLRSVLLDLTFLTFIFICSFQQFTYCEDHLLFFHSSSSFFILFHSLYSPMLFGQHAKSLSLSPSLTPFS